MLDLPASLTRHFRDAHGRLDHRRLLHTPDERLLALARQMPEGERVTLYRRLCGLRLSWMQRLLAQSAGIDGEAQRRRFLRILEAAAVLPPVATGATVFAQAASPAR